MGLFKKSIDYIKNLGVKELTPKESVEMIKNLMKTSSVKIQSNLLPGNLITFVYDAKDKSQKFDRTPFVMVLSKTSKYMLGVNFHWMPVSHRSVLVDYILRKNSKRIRMKKPLKMGYRELRAAVKGIGAFPVVRLYIRARMSPKGVLVPSELLRDAAKMKTETFTQGKANSTTLWQRAKQKYKSTKRKILK